MDTYGVLCLVIGVLLAAISVVQLKRHDGLAGGIYGWYTNKPDPHSRPGWLPWQIRATHRQTGAIAYGGCLASAGLSL